MHFVADLKRPNIYGLNETYISSRSFLLIIYGKYHWKLYREIDLSVVRSVFHIVCWGFIEPSALNDSKSCANKILGTNDCTEIYYYKYLLQLISMVQIDS